MLEYVVVSKICGRWYHAPPLPLAWIALSLFVCYFTVKWSEVCRTALATTWTNVRYVPLSCARQTRSGMVRPVHSLRSSDHCFFWPPWRLFPGIGPSMMSLASELWRTVWPKCFSLWDLTLASNPRSLCTLVSIVSFVICSVYGTFIDRR